jgi:hypothetical protein
MYATDYALCFYNFLFTTGFLLSVGSMSPIYVSPSVPFVLPVEDCPTFIPTVSESGATLVLTKFFTTNNLEEVTVTSVTYACLYSIYSLRCVWI